MASRYGTGAINSGKTINQSRLENIQRRNYRCEISSFLTLVNNFLNIKTFTLCRKFPSRLLLASVALFLSSCTSNGSTLTEQDTTTIKVGGSSETYATIELLTDAYVDQTDRVDFKFLPPSQTDSGIQGVSNRELDIGGVSRSIDATANSPFKYAPLIVSPLVVVVHNSVTGVDNLTTEQLKSIYSGEISNWQQVGGPDAEIVLLDLVEDENEKKLLRDHYLGADLAITPRAVVFAEDDELLETAANTEYSLAAVVQEDDIEQAPVKQLSLDGIAPSDENMASNDYAMSILLGMVYHNDADVEVKSFVEFVAGPEGQAILAEAEDEDEDEA